MNEAMITTLNPKNDINNLLGELALNPKFLTEADVNINKNYAVNHFQKIILAALLDLANESNYSKSIDAYSVDNFIRNYPKAYKVWKANNGPRFLNDLIALSPNHIQSDYEMTKKFYYLRKYLKNGIDIRDLFNYNKPDDTQIAKIRQMKTSYIIDYFSNKTDKIRKNYQDNSNNIQSFEIQDGLVNHVRHLSKTAQFGYPFQDRYYNQLFGGMHKNKLMIRSTVTGGGKTRQALKDFCNVAFSKYHTFNGNKWIHTGDPKPALFISTELNKDELQNIILAYVTGMQSKIIAAGNFDRNQKELINKAVRVIQDSKFYFEYVEDFTSEQIENLISKYARQKGVRYVDFDYIQDTPHLMQELKQSYGNGLRSDQELVYLSKELKRIAEKYHVFIMSATQVNGNYMNEDEKFKSRTEYTLRGGKSIADKADYGVIISRFNKVDKRAFSKNHDLNKYHPNYAHYVYKNRNGENRVIVWTKFNFGNLHETPLVVTDYNYNILSGKQVPLDKRIEPLTINYK